MVLNFNRFEIIKTEYLVKNRQPIIHLFVRDKENVKHILHITGFESYFYIDNGTLSPTTVGVKRIENDYVKWNKETCQKVITSTPKDVSILKKKAGKNWESKILYPNRFLIDNKIFRAIKIKSDIDITQQIDYKELIPTEFSCDSLRTCYLDIEIVCDKKDLNINFSFDDVKRLANHSVSHISFVDSFTNKKYLLEYVPKLKQDRLTRIKSEFELYKSKWVKFILSKDKDITHIKFRKETDLLNGFVNLFHTFDFDVWQSYNLIGFDFPYLLDRMDNLNINYSKLSQLRVANKKTIYGIELLDTLKMLKQLLRKGIPRYTLDYVSNKFVPERTKVNISENISEELKSIIFKLTHSKSVPSNIISWIFYYGTQDDKRLLASYNLEDSVVIQKLDEKKRLLASRRVLAKVLGTHMSQTFKPVGFAMNYLLRFSHNKIVMPNTMEFEKKELQEKEKGAEVLDPSTCVLNNVGVVDYTRLYPTIMCDGNISFETMDKDGDIKLIDLYTASGIWMPDDKLKYGVYDSTVKSMFYDAFQFLFAYRMSIQEKLILVEPESEEYNLLNEEQNALKHLINSFYGFLKFLDTELLGSVTFWGRILTLFTVKCIEENTHYKVLYGDTDSVFVYFGENKDKTQIIEAGHKLSLILNMAYKKLFESIGIYDTNISVKFEKVGVFAQAGAKKRYGFKVIWDKDWKTDNVEYKFKGLEMQRSDWSQFARDTQEVLWTMILDRKDNEEILNYLKERKNYVIQSIKSMTTENLLYLSLPKRISKELDEYKGSYTNNVSVRAARYSRAVNINIGNGKYYMMYIYRLKQNPWNLKINKSKNIKKPALNAILFSTPSELTELMNYCDIDINTYIEKQLISPSRSIFLLTGINPNDIDLNVKKNKRVIKQRKI